MKRLVILTLIAALIALVAGCSVPRRAQYANVRTIYNATLQLAQDAFEAGLLSDDDILRIQPWQQATGAALNRMGVAVANGDDDTAAIYLDAALTALFKFREAVRAGRAEIQPDTPAQPEDL
jgi:hypothetical protein